MRVPEVIAQAPGRLPPAGRIELALTWAIVLAAAACGRPERTAAPAPPRARTPRAANAAFVGRAACAPCHAAEAARWQGSHHDLAMQEATAKTVLGDFSGARFRHFGVTSRFTKREGKFFVTTDGPDGRPHEYPIAYTFGVYPLQQYLIAFPGGRYQALNVVWDTRPAKEGGQRWFHLYPKEEDTHDDPLHWTGRYQNWNFMCAECHSTNVKKGYSTAADTYATTFSEIDVSCEACHGPGSAHVAWAEAVKAGRASKEDADRGMAVVLRDPAKTALWEMDMTTGISKRSVPRTSRTEIETCARCHSRRSVLAADYVYGQPLGQTHRPLLLDDPLYYADGQIQDEVYEYASFLQSKMFAAGVSCSDCHDPHDLKVKGSADRVCTACHLTERFDTPKHTFHKAGSTGARCVACHMPTRNYMVVHARHDHSMRVPRPDLSVTLGMPNACTDCHRNKSARWASDAALKWWGDRLRRTPHYGELAHAGRAELAGAPAALAAYVSDRTQPAIRRATAASLLDPSVPVARVALQHAVADADPLVRQGAVPAAEALQPADRVSLLAPLLRDPILAVRIEAARALAFVPPDAMSSSQRADFDAAFAETVRSLEVDADRAEAHLSLGSLFAARGENEGAERELKQAISLTPAIAGAWANLADLYRAQGREPEAETTLRKGLSAAPRDPGLHHALGLALVRAKMMPEALRELALAATLPPERPRYAYVYAVALDSVGETRKAIELLSATEARHTGNREILEALAAFSERIGDRTAAASWADKLVALWPEDQRARALRASLGQPAAAPVPIR